MYIQYHSQSGKQAGQGQVGRLERDKKQGGRPERDKRQRGRPERDKRQGGRPERDRPGREREAGYFAHYKEHA